MSYKQYFVLMLFLLPCAYLNFLFLHTSFTTVLTAFFSSYTQSSLYYVLFEPRKKLIPIINHNAASHNLLRCTLRFHQKKRRILFHSTRPFVVYFLLSFCPLVYRIISPSSCVYKQATRMLAAVVIYGK